MVLNVIPWPDASSTTYFRVEDVCPFCRQANPILSQDVDDLWSVNCYGCKIRTFGAKTKEDAYQDWQNHVASVPQQEESSEERDGAMHRLTVQQLGDATIPLFATYNRLAYRERRPYGEVKAAHIAYLEAMNAMLVARDGPDAQVYDIAAIIRENEEEENAQ